jgi:competence protein ComEC
VYRFLGYGVSGFLVGVAWRSLASVELAGIAALFLCAAAVVAVGYLRGTHVSWYVLLAVCACVVGIVRTELAFTSYASHQVYPDGTTLNASGVVIEEPDVRADYTVLVVDRDGGNGETTLRVRMKVPLYPTFTYGDRVDVTGTLHLAQAFETDNGRVFDYAGYLMKEGIHYEVRDPRVRIVGEGAGNPLVAHLLRLKAHWLAVVSRLLPEPNASLAGGVVVGAKRSLGDEWLAAFRTTGIIHIVVLSGYNLTLIANSVVRALASLPRSMGLVGGAFGVVSFALMTGASSTIVRASIMAILAMVAASVNRPYDVLRALLLAGVVMVLWNPFVLLFDTGFQLSFMATVGLIFGAPLVETYLVWITTVGGLRGIVAATLATQFAVLPILAYQIGSLSIVAPLVNVLVLPVVSPVMALVSVAGLVGMVSLTLALPFAWLAHLLLSYMFLIVGTFAHVPFAAATLPPLDWVWVPVMYGAIYLVYRRMTKPARLVADGIARQD